jgi:hypothetical protein
MGVSAYGRQRRASFKPRGVSLGGAWTSGRVNGCPGGECGRFDVGVGGRGISMYPSRPRTSKIQAPGQREASRCLLRRENPSTALAASRSLQRGEWKWREGKEREGSVLGLWYNSTPRCCSRLHTVQDMPRQAWHMFYEPVSSRTTRIGPFAHRKDGRISHGFRPSSLLRWRRWRSSDSNIMRYGSCSKA